MKSLHIGAIVLLLAIIQKTEGSNLSSYGSEFYLAFPRNVNGALNLTFTVHTLKTTSVEFSINSLDESFSYTGTTTAGNPDIVAIPISYEVLYSSFAFRRLGLHISSLETEPVSVVAWNDRVIGFMSYLGLPCHTQPTNEYIYYGVSTLGLNDFFGYVLLVGCRNNTNVTVVPSRYANVTMPINPQLSISAHKTYRLGENNTFVLHAGQTLLMHQAYADLTGTKIISDAPLSVISGHLLSRVPVQYNDAEPIMTQVPPTITWGRYFLLSPHHNRPNGQFYKIIAHRNNTIVQRKCGSSPSLNTTLALGQVYNFSTTYTTYCSVIASKPIFIAQVGVSTFFNDGYFGDPTLNTVPPIDQFIHSIEFTPYLVTLLTAINILIPNDQYFDNNLIVNGIKYYNVTWTKVIHYPNGSIAGYALAFSATVTSTITHSDPLGKLFLSVFGWTVYGGYCFSGGMGLNPINPVLPLPEVSFTSQLYSVTEGDSTNALVYLNRSVNIEKQVSVRMRVAPLQVDTARVGKDYQSVNKVISFGPEETIKTVTIPIINDELVESTEYFTLRLEAIGEEVLVFPITESVVQIFDNDYVQIGFSNTSLTLANTTDLSLELTNHYGVLQPGEVVHVLLQVENITDGALENISRFDFYYYSGSYIASLNLSDLPFSLIYTNNSAIVKGRLSLVSSTVNATIQPSVITFNYSQVLSTEQPVYVTTSVIQTVTYTHSPDRLTSSQEVVVSTVYSTPTSSKLCLSNISTVSITPSSSTTYIVNDASTETTCPTITNCLSMAAESVALSSNVILGGVMGYVILLILCTVGIVGGFFCGRNTAGRSARNDTTLSTSNNYPLPYINDYEGQHSIMHMRNSQTEFTQSSKQFIPLPALPIKDSEEIYDELYMEMASQQKKEQEEEPKYDEMKKP